MADHFEVSMRTVERDLAALQQAGAPIWANTGRSGGYAIDTRATLGPMAFTPDEALATLIALSSLRRGPFRQAAASALRKVVAVTPEVDAQPAVALASRYRFLEPDAPVTPVPAEFAEALRANRVLRLEYRDRNGTVSRRDVEPLGYIEKEGNWYLVAWCRLRDDIRAFRGDRTLSASVTDERPEPRAFSLDDLDIPDGILRPVID